MKWSRAAWLLIHASLILVIGCPPSRKPQSNESVPAEKRQVRVKPRTQEPEINQYTIRFPERQRHYVEVEAIFPASQGETLELAMAVWTPGSYLVREYSRHIDRIAAFGLDGEPRTLEKTRKNRWRVEESADAVVVRYRIYAHDLSTRGNFVDSDFAFLNGAPTFLTVAGHLHRAHDVLIELPKAWSQSVSGLPLHSDRTPHHYLAPDYDTLVDSPIVLGNPSVQDFRVDDVPHRLATSGGRGLWDDQKATRDVQKIVQSQIDFWDSVPYEDYVFLNVLEFNRRQRSTGLEHLNSTLILANPWATKKRASYKRWLSLVAHEFFHTWNVKRLRPKSLGPFDYEREVYTRDLWIAEGLTSYYADLLMRRARLYDRNDFLATLSTRIRAVESAPGRLAQSLADASYDAWIKFYRPNENTNNSTISYYHKGAIVGFLLDAAIRKTTGGTKSLDHVMRMAFARFSGAEGFQSNEFRALASQVAGRNLSTFFANTVDGTTQLDYSDALEWYGLRLVDPKHDDDDDDPPAGYLGIKTYSKQGRLLVREVVANTPAASSGISAGDEILAVENQRADPEDWEVQLSYFPPGETVTLLVSRRSHVRRVSAKLARQPKREYTLQVSPAATLVQQEHLRSWLAPSN